MRRVVVVATAAVVASIGLAACAAEDTEPTGTGPTGGGSISFSYSGPLSGTYDASGTRPTSEGAWDSEWVEGYRHDQQGVFIVDGNIPRPEGKADNVIISTPGAAIGSKEICGELSCASISLSIGGSPGTIGGGEMTCHMNVSGSVNITHLTESNARGTFSASGDCYVPGSDTPSPGTITNGTFDVVLDPSANTSKGR